METEVIKPPENYASAIKEIDGLMSAEVGTAEGRRLEILANRVQEYEAKHFPMRPATEAGAAAARRLKYRP
jgi:HTH-type transcriptional regulator/antitoxin HigA